MTRDELIAKMGAAFIASHGELGRVLDVVLAAGERRWFCHRSGAVGTKGFCTYTGTAPIGGTVTFTKVSHPGCGFRVVLPDLGDGE